MFFSGAKLSLIMVSMLPVMEGHIVCVCFPADDAKEAVKIGVNGILVSNHGARQLDGVPATVSTDANIHQ